MRLTAHGILSTLVAVMGISIACDSAPAIPFQFTYRGTTDLTLIPGTNAGDPVVITVLADNGGSSVLSQSWNYDDLLYATLATGTYQATYGAPLISNLDPSFRTDASGTLNRVEFLGGVIGVNSDNFGTGGDILLLDDLIIDYHGNPAFLSDALSSPDRLRFWTGPTAAPIPEPATFGLLSLGLLAGAAVARRRHD